MTVEIVDVYDKERGCGFRKQRGFYLRMDASKVTECGKMPLRLLPCEHCGIQVKLTRGLARVNVKNLFQNVDCSHPDENCRFCLINRTGWGYLIGIEAKHYKTRDDFRREMLEQGISKRVAFPLPRDFKVKQSVVLLGHPKVFTELVPESAIERPVVEIDEDTPQKSLPIIDGRSDTTGRMVARDIPAIVAIFVPQRVEYVVDGTEPMDFLESLVSQNVTLVRVHREEPEKQLELEGAA